MFSFTVMRFILNPFVEVRTALHSFEGFMVG